MINRSTRWTWWTLTNWGKIMRECSIRMIRLETNDPHHRIYVERALFEGGSHNHIIMTFEVGNEVTEHPDRGHKPNVNEAADIQEARAFAHTLATIEVAPWRKP